MNIPFNFPVPSGYDSSPKWDGKVFSIDGAQIEVLEYSENFSGWSDDLTALHEEVCGSNHPIDIASRSDAISQVTKCSPDSSTVIMEVGCSTGFLLKELLYLFPTSTIIGADVVKEPLYRLARILPGTPLVRFDLLKSPLPSEVVDILIMLNVLEHIENDDEALVKAFNLLKPGGKIILEVPAGPYLFDDYDRQLKHFRRYSASELENKLKAAGFSISRKSHLGFILFPAFALVKCFSKLLSIGDGKSVVKDRASKTGGSIIMKWVMNFESKYLCATTLPFGIRILITGKKP